MRFYLFYLHLFRRKIKCRYLPSATIVVFVGRMFVNLAIVRRYYIDDKWMGKMKAKKEETIKEIRYERTLRQGFALPGGLCYKNIAKILQKYYKNY